MSDVFYVVSGSGDDVSAVVFNRGDKDADNESAANEFLAERRKAAPWDDHKVMTADEYDNASAPQDPETTETDNKSEGTD